jgi:hypothetical protein
MNQRHQSRSRRNRIRQQGDGNVSASQSLAHDPRTDDSHPKKGCSDKLGADSSE